jgi:hypothetical protein
MISAFLTNLLLGETISFALMKPLAPDISCFVQYPYYPASILPHYHKMKEAETIMLAKLKTTPNWEFIQKVTKDVDLDEESACRLLLVTLAFNGPGIMLPMMNILLTMSTIPANRHVELINNSALFDSYIWEIMRFMGPELVRQVKTDTTIVSGSGDKYVVKAGTKLYTDLSLVNRDANVWSQPDILKPDRYINGSERVPVTSFGCPLRLKDDKERHQLSHQCGFMNLVHPTLKHFTLFLVNDFNWKLDSLSIKTILSCIHEHHDCIIPHLNYKNENLNNGPNPMYRYIPKDCDDMKFVSFLSKHA